MSLLFALVIYAGGGLALPPVLDSSIPQLVVATVFATSVAGAVMPIWLATRH